MIEDGCLVDDDGLPNPDTPSVVEPQTCWASVWGVPLIEQLSHTALRFLNMSCFAASPEIAIRLYE